MKKKYVVGFAFSHDYERVVLIRKNKPEWQAGYLNGVGGKVEDGETYEEAMIREFTEEAGVRIPTWKEFALLEFENTEIMCFIGKLRLSQEKEVRSVTDEKVGIYNTIMIDTMKTIPNLQWLIPMALNDTENTYYIKTNRYDG